MTQEWHDRARDARVGMAQERCPDLSDVEWSLIQPLLPTKSRGVPRVNDRRVLNGILWRLRTGAPWAEIPERYGPHMTCVNRFSRWRRAGIWDAILGAISAAYGDAIALVDASTLHAHHPGVAAAPDADAPVAWVLQDGATVGDDRPRSDGWSDWRI